MSNVCLVYSTDPKDKVATDKGPQEGINALVNTSQFTIIFRVEKSGRGGKTVTVMQGFPRNEDYVKCLAKELKAKCGTGGTHTLTEKDAAIEIQGDKRDQLKKLLDAKGIKHRGM